jgi:hypothetical protein
MELPYSLDVYFELMAGYNARWSPVVLSGAILALAAAGLALSPAVRSGRWPWRAIILYLAASWIWVGAVHQLDMMAGLNFMAPVYGVGWIVQGVILAYWVIRSGETPVRFAGGRTGVVAVASIAGGLALYPLSHVLAGQDWLAAPTVGTAANPTALFTAGMLLAYRDGAPIILFGIPLAWAGVAASSGWLLNYPPDLFVAAAIVIVFAIRAAKGLSRV